MTANRQAFTIIEILVASSLFMMLMGIAAFSFQRLNEGGRYAQKIVELHQRSDSIIRLLEEDLRTLQQTAAIHIDQKSNPRSFTFVRQVTNYEQQGFGGNDLVSSITGLGEEERYRSDQIWVKLLWGNGDFSRASTRPHHIQEGWTGDHRYVDNTRQFLKSVNFHQSGSGFCGMHRNGLPATPQKEFVHYYGNGRFASVNADGSTNANPGDQIAVFQKISTGDYTGNDCRFFDLPESPWRVDHDYSHWFTTYRVGNDDVLSNEAFAVCNPDGKSFNKDRLNLEGCSDTDPSGNYFYPDRKAAIFAGVEYMTMNFFKKDGTEISDSDDDDTISDGAQTIDINGIEADASGGGIEKRPLVVRISFLLHSLDQNEIDETDYDADGDDTEYLVQAVRDVVESEGHGSRQDKIASFKNHCRTLSASSVLVNYAVKLGL